MSGVIAKLLKLALIAMVALAGVGLGSGACTLVGRPGSDQASVDRPDNQAGRLIWAEEAVRVNLQVGRAIDLEEPGLELIPLAWRGVRAWAGTGGFSRLVVAQANGHVYRVGGFRAPELISLNAALQAQGMPLRDRIDILIFLNETASGLPVAIAGIPPSAAGLFRFPVHRWEEVKPFGAWPADTAVKYPGGLQLISRAAAISGLRDGRYAPGDLQPVRYAMVVSADGTLLAWNRIEGKSFPEQ